MVLHSHDCVVLERFQLYKWKTYMHYIATPSPFSLVTGTASFPVFIGTPSVDLSCNCTICSSSCLNVFSWHLSRSAIVHCACPSSLTVTGTHLYGLGHTLFIHSSVDGNLDHFHPLASGENDAMTIDV